MKTELRNEIARLYETVSGASGKVFYDEPDKTIKLPYYLFRQTSNPEDSDTKTDHWNTTIQFDFLGKNLTDLETFADAIDVVFKAAKSNISLTNHTLGGVVFIDEQAFVEDDVHHIIKILRFDLSET